MSTQHREDRIGHWTALLGEAFRAPTKAEAHRRARPVLRDMAGDGALIAAVLEKHLRAPATLNRQNYPVVTLAVELNADYGLDMNCWIPLPGGETNISTKAIHHHGNMLLTTATAFGPGYEHWTFERPRLLDAGRELYALGLLERRQHGPHDVAFVDSDLPHLPVYPGSLTITLALWSNKHPTTWKDRLKRVPLLKRNERLLRRFVRAAGLTRALDVKVVEYFDFYPVAGGFKGIRQRTEFPLGPNADFLHSLFHILQQTGNAHLGAVVQEHLDTGAPLENRELARELLGDLRAGRPIAARLSEGHHGVPEANFTTDAIEQALAGARGRELCHEPQIPLGGR
jgi:hypothetical protein